MATKMYIGPTYICVITLYWIESTQTVYTHAIVHNRDPNDIVYALSQ